MREARQRVLERRERAKEQGEQGEQEQREQQSGSWERLQELLTRASDSSAARGAASRLFAEPRVRARVTEGDSSRSYPA